MQLRMLQSYETTQRCYDCKDEYPVSKRFEDTSSRNGTPKSEPAPGFTLLSEWEFSPHLYHRPYKK